MQKQKPNGTGSLGDADSAHLSPYFHISTIVDSKIDLIYQFIADAWVTRK